jgi:lysyl-tRNA synthetase, class II
VLPRARALKQGERLPALAGAVAFAIGIVNLGSALTPNVGWRGHLLLAAEPVRALPLFHTLAVPASAALIVASVYLKRRRRRACHVALALLLGLGVVNLLKGLDFEESALSFGAAGLLWWARDAFCVRQAPLRLRSPLWGLVAVFGAVGAVGALFVWAVSGRRAEPATVLRETLDLLAGTQGGMTFHDELGRLPLAFGSVTLTAIAIGGWLLFRSLPPSREPAGEHARRSATRLVREHGADTLAFFKLRRDLQYLFAPDGNGFLGYRIEGNVLLVAGDPVAPPTALPALVRAAAALAELHGLQLAALGAGRELLPLWRANGMRALYIGDEAIVETARFTLEGRPVRKLRQAVNRVESAGFSAELVAVEELDEATTAALDHFSASWRGGAPERGFTMAMDSLEPGSRVALARDAGGTVRAFLHLVPVYGRPAASLSLMRREPQTPNGLTEFLIVRAIEQLRARGVEELSLNFAAFGRLVERPGLLAPLLRFGSRHFQIESLYRFNAKFSPRWEPRYLVFESVLALPRAGLAALWAEGQLPRLRFRD